jgi:hypothetical protein
MRSTPRHRHGAALSCILVAMCLGGPATATADGARVRTETQLRRAWAEPQRTRIDLGADIVLRDCERLEPIRESPYPMRLDGHGHTLRQSCFERRLVRQDGTGPLDLRRVTLTRGGAVGSTGDILVVRSQVDGNTTDGDGGALYTDEDGDVTVISSLIDGSDADGPGGAIFTLDGDVAVLDSTLIGNRADDRGGAISGEADVLLVNSTVARNLAVAHPGGASGPAGTSCWSTRP